MFVMDVVMVAVMFVVAVTPISTAATVPVTTIGPTPKAVAPSSMAIKIIGVSITVAIPTHVCSSSILPLQTYKKRNFWKLVQQYYRVAQERE